MNPLITLTTDFGLSSPYVAAMKGVVLSINPQAQVIDLCHAIPPQEVRHAAWFLREAVPFFPPNALHLVVVDPGVGTARALLYIETMGRKLLAPDNGVWSWLPSDAPPRVIELQNRNWWREAISATFHGRDILAPVAAHLSLGMDPTQLGMPRREWVQLPMPIPQLVDGRVEGEVLFIDDFGNLITNIPASYKPSDQTAALCLGERIISRWVLTYAEASSGEVVALVSSGGWIEIAQVNGNAARALGAQRGMRVTLFSL